MMMLVVLMMVMCVTISLYVLAADTLRLAQTLISFTTANAPEIIQSLEGVHALDIVLVLGFVDPHNGSILDEFG